MDIFVSEEYHSENHSSK